MTFLTPTQFINPLTSDEQRTIMSAVLQSPALMFWLVKLASAQLVLGKSRRVVLSNRS